MEKEHPILFSTPMVQAILAGRKTQTRRVIKFPSDFKAGGAIFPNGSFGIKYESTDFDGCIKRHSAKYLPGDKLWVRETFGITGKTTPPYVYRADDQDLKIEWKPSIFMPRNANRITLEVIKVSAEPLNDITEADAKAEGVETNADGTWHDYLQPKRLYQDDAKASFISLWMKINGTPSWNSNPLVWVIEFKRV